MKKIINLILLLCCYFFPTAVYAQIYNLGDSVYNMVITQVPVGVNAGTWNYALMKSASDRVSKKTPLVIGFHGQGETGSSISQMIDTGTTITKHGIARNIRNGNMPRKIKNFRTGDSVEFNYLFIQRRISTAPYTKVSLIEVLNYIPTLMPWVDTSNIFLYGISMGGGSASQFLKDANTDILKRIRGVVLMSSVSETGTYTLTDAGQARYQKTPIYCQWSTTDAVGNVVSWNNKLRDSLNKYDANHVTVNNYTGGHCCWTVQSAPDRKQSVNFMWGGTHNVNTMEWMASYLNYPSSTIPISTASNLGDSAYNMIVTRVKVNVDAGPWNYALMKSAKDTTKKSPLVIGFHGADHTGYGIGKMVSDTGIWVDGLARNIAEGIMPNKFRNFRTGDSTEFNFIFPQRSVAAMYTAEGITEMLNYIGTTYSWIDTTNVFFYGIGLGGNTAGVPMVDDNEIILERVRGFVLMSASYPHHNPAKRTLKQPNGIKDKQKPVYIQWSLSDATSGVSAWNNQLRDTLNHYNANQVTQYLHGSGHGGWTAASHPGRKQNVNFMWGGTYNVNTMEWMASHVGYSSTSLRTKSQMETAPLTQIIPEDRTTQIRMYPNPVTSELYIRDNNGRAIIVKSFRIYNSEGRIVLQGSKKSVIPVHNIPAGIYYLQIHESNRTVTRQFVKK